MEVQGCRTLAQPVCRALAGEVTTRAPTVAEAVEDISTTATFWAKALLDKKWQHGQAEEKGRQGPRKT